MSNNGAVPGSCQSNCAPGAGVSGVSVFVEPEAGVQPIINAISSAQASVWVEMYLLTNRSIMKALEEAANRGLDVRVMLETHPYGSGSASPTEALDRLRAAGIKAQPASPDFALTHEKCMLIDGAIVYIMTSNFTNSALGVGSFHNREYDIVDSNTADVQAAQAIFQADWDHTQAQFNDANLVVSPVNAHHDITALINSAQKTLLIEGEEMQDSVIEQAIIDAARRGVQVQVILPMPNGVDSNAAGIAVIKQGGAYVREDARLYMHAKMITVDGRTAFVGSENISTQSLDHNRELGIILADQEVITTLQQTFQQDWGDSQDV